MKGKRRGEYELLVADPGICDETLKGLARCQDVLACHHWELYQGSHPELSYGDWERILSCGRIREFILAGVGMVYAREVQTGGVVGYLSYSRLDAAAAASSSPSSSSPSPATAAERQTFLRVNHLVVAPEHRGFGVGRRLMSTFLEQVGIHSGLGPPRAEGDAEERGVGVQIIAAELNEGAIAWYRSLGFRAMDFHIKENGGCEICYLDLRRCWGSVRAGGGTHCVPHFARRRGMLFGQELCGEGVKIAERESQPGGTHLSSYLRVLHYDAERGLHLLEGLGAWVDLSAEFASGGGVQFQRALHDLLGVRKKPAARAPGRASSGRAGDAGFRRSSSSKSSGPSGGGPPLSNSRGSGGTSTAATPGSRPAGRPPDGGGARRRAGSRSRSSGRDSFGGAAASLAGSRASSAEGDSSSQGASSPATPEQGVRRRSPSRRLLQKAAAQRDPPNSDADAETTDSGPDEWEDWPCGVCGRNSDDGAMILCDGKGGSCNATYHYYCVGLRAVPEGEWLCPPCAAEAAAAEAAAGSAHPRRQRLRAAGSARQRAAPQGPPEPSATSAPRAASAMELVGVPRCAHQGAGGPVEVQFTDNDPEEPQCGSPHSSSGSSTASCYESPLASSAPCGTLAEWLAMKGPAAGSLADSNVLEVPLSVSSSPVVDSPPKKACKGGCGSPVANSPPKKACKGGCCSPVAGRPPKKVDKVASPSLIATAGGEPGADVAGATPAKRLRVR